MLTTATDQLGKSVREWTAGVRAILQERADTTGVAAIDDADRQWSEARFVLTVLGKAKRGKSTLINALLGRRDDLIAPIDKLPASNAITRISSGDADSARVQFRDGRNEPIDFSRIREFVTEEGNPQNAKQVDVVDVRGRFAGLADSLELVDTPGAGSVHEHHDALLYAFIPQSDAVIFLVTARMPLDQDELDLLKRVKAADIQKIFFVINRIDELSEPDIAAAEQHNRTLLAQAGVSVDRIYRISAKRAFQGDLVQSGVPELMTAIGECLAENKGRILLDRCATRVCQAATPTLQALQVEVASCQKTAVEVKADAARLQVAKSDLEHEQQFASQEFTLAWNRAIDEFEFSLSSAQSDVITGVVSQINRTGLTEISKLARDVPTIFSTALDERLNPTVRRLEESLHKAGAKLQADHPAIDLVPSGELVIHTRAGNTMIAGSVGGAVGVTTGLGVASAGMAAAQAIAVANATALAATTTVTVPTLLSSGLGLVGLEFLAPFATGTATLATPAAITATPLWVALAGPIGWTLAGLGVLAIPLAWRASKLKARDQLETAAREQVKTVFTSLRADRIPALRKMSSTIAEEFRLRLSQRIHQIQSALQAAEQRQTRPEDRDRLVDTYQRLQSRLTHIPCNSESSVSGSPTAVTS